MNPQLVTNNTGFVLWMEMFNQSYFLQPNSQFQVDGNGFSGHSHIKHIGQAKVRSMEFVNTESFNCIKPTVLNVEWQREEILQII
jgi:hypothetical protein